jgi:hypothetical protein
MGRPKKQLCDQNSEIFAKNLSCLRAASGRRGNVIRIVFLTKASRVQTREWPSRRLIFYTQFPYLLSARPDQGRLASGRLNLNCDSCFMFELVWTGVHVVRTVKSIYPYLNLERKSEVDQSLEVIWTGY